MNRRTLVILAGAGLAMVALLLLTRADFDRDRDAGGLHAPGLAERIGDLESLRLVHAGSEVVATIERGETGWAVVEKSGHPADFERLRSVLNALARARRVEKKTALPEFYARLGVEDPSAPDAGGYLLELEYGRRHPAEGYIIGRRAGSGMAYIRTAGEPQSWMVSADFDLSDQTRDWVDREIIDLASGEVRRVAMDRGGGDVLEIAKDEAGDINFTPVGIPEGRELSYGSVANSIASALANVQANDVRSAAGVDALPRAARVDYETFDGLKLSLDVRKDASVAVEEGSEDAGAAAPRYWASFSATAGEPEANAPPAPDAVEESAAAASEESPAAASEESPAAASEESPAAASEESAAASDDSAPHSPGPQARAAELNARLGGWAYELPAYKSDQWFKRMDDLLKDE